MLSRSAFLIRERTKPVPEEHPVAHIDGVRGVTPTQSAACRGRGFPPPRRRHVDAPHLLRHCLQRENCTLAYAAHVLDRPLHGLPNSIMEPLRDWSGVTRALEFACIHRSALSAVSFRTLSGVSASSKKAWSEYGSLFSDFSGHETQMLFEIMHIVQGYRFPLRLRLVDSRLQGRDH